MLNSIVLTRLGGEIVRVRSKFGGWLRRGGEAADSDGLQRRSWAVTARMYSDGGTFYMKLACFDAEYAVKEWCWPESFHGLEARAQSKTSGIRG
jgi:hypothetical protein